MSSKKKKYNTSIFVFRRDLRLEDNTALISALKNSDKVLPCFFLDPEQASQDNNFYFSHNAFQFMIESIKELDSELSKKGAFIHIFNGKPVDILQKIIEVIDVDAVFFNKDYTPFSIKRDKALIETCKKYKIASFSYDDALLIPPAEANKPGSEYPYVVFTPFYREMSKREIQEPRDNFYSNYKNLSKNIIQKIGSFSKVSEINYEKNKNLGEVPGRKHALKVLSDTKSFRNYPVERDILSKEATSMLSAHNKFGTISIREVYHSFSSVLSKIHPIVRQLYWRDFFTNIAYYYPYIFGKSFRLKFESLQWNNDKILFKKWCEGKTGFPIVDAGMRQLNTTGYMHNRARMIVSSFLVKDLHIDWRKGEMYFAQKLVDYDPSVNNGGWQWAASTGCDAQPYFRIFNPESQQKRFDKDCYYVKRWIPELADTSCGEIYSYYSDKPSRNNKLRENGYVFPLVEHSVERKNALAYYKKASS